MVFIRIERYYKIIFLQIYKLTSPLPLPQRVQPLLQHSQANLFSQQLYDEGSLPRLLRFLVHIEWYIDHRSPPSRGSSTSDISNMSSFRNVGPTSSSSSTYQSPPNRGSFTPSVSNMSFFRKVGPTSSSLVLNRRLLQFLLQLFCKQHPLFNTPVEVGLPLPKKG